MKIDRGKIGQLGREFRDHKAYGYASVGALFDTAMLAAASGEVDQHLDRYPAEPDHYGSFRKYRLSTLAQMPERTRDLIGYLHSPDFLQVLSEITAIDGLQPDPELRGGGIHAIGRGGYLKIHTDFNWHRGLSLHRRLNLLIYLNPAWDSAWNGDIELWSADARRRIFSLAPRLGNALLFETNDVSHHGHPDPLRCPEGTFRTSIALYYYTATRTADGIQFGKSEMTNFVERPAEKFATDKWRQTRHRLQLRARKLVHALRSSHDRTP
jgi:hypothetical protein